MDETTNPETEVAEEDFVEAPEADVEETEAEGDEAETADAEEGAEPSEDDSEETEYEGKRYKLPKELKEALLRQADYTRKTQEVAEQRRQIEQAQVDLVARAEAQRALVKDYAKVESIAERVEAYDKVDWQTLSRDDPGAAQQHWIQYQTLKDQQAKLVGEIQAKEQARSLEAQQEIAKQIQQGQEVLAREIKGWGPEAAQKVSRFATENYGVTPQELATITDPRIIKLLHDAMTLRESQKATQVAKKAAEVVAVKPVKSLGTKTSAAKDPNRMTTEEWVKWRNEQVAKRR
jgi:hypothetical protein